MAHGSPAENEGRPSGGTLIPGNIKSAPPMTNRETSPPFSIKEGNSSGTVQRAKTARWVKRKQNLIYTFVIIKLGESLL